jgi:hypothetical protein
LSKEAWDEVSAHLKTRWTDISGEVKESAQKKVAAVKSKVAAAKNKVVKKKTVKKA